MRRERTRPKRFALACAFGGLAVLLWQLATASTAPERSEPPPDTLMVLSAHPQPRALLEGTSVLNASFAASSASRRVAAVPSRVQGRPFQGVPESPPPEERPSSAPPA